MFTGEQLLLLNIKAEYRCNAIKYKHVKLLLYLTVNC